MAFGLEVTPLGAAVHTPIDGSPEFVGLGPLGPVEMAELAEFQRRGWRFTPALDGKGLPGELVNAGYGVLVQRPEGGLAIARSRLVAEFAGGFKPEPILGPYEPWERLPWGDNIYRLTLPPPPADTKFNDAIEQEMETLRGLAHGNVVWVEPVFTVRLAVGKPSEDTGRRRSAVPPPAPVPPYDSSLQWQWPKIHLADAWVSAGSKGAGAVVAVIDHGFFTNFLPTPIKPLISLKSDGSNLGSDFTGTPHGTFCAALAASRADGHFDNGVAPECGLLLVAVDNLMDSDGFGKAVNRCASEGADVISSSVSPFNGWPHLNVLQTAIVAVQNAGGRGGKGCVVAWAVSNNEGPIAADDIAGYPPVLSVGPTRFDDSRGPCGHGAGLKVVAPGMGVRGLYAQNATGFSITDQIGGASYATPVVAGIAALIVSARPDLTGAQIVDSIQNHCDPLPKGSPKGEVKHGCVNADAAVRAALSLP